VRQRLSERFLGLGTTQKPPTCGRAEPRPSSRWR